MSVDTGPAYYQDVVNLTTGKTVRHLYNADRCYLGTYEPASFAGELEPLDPGPPPQARVTRRMTVRHPAGTITLGDGLEVDVELRRDALGSLIHARVPVMAPGDCGEVGHAHEPHCDRHQVGTAVLITYKTLPDGSAVDAEFDVDLG